MAGFEPYRERHVWCESTTTATPPRAAASSGLSNLPEGGPRAEQLEVVAGHEQAARGDRFLHDRDVLRGRQSGEVACLPLQRLIVRQAEPLAVRGVGVPTQRVQRMRVGQVDRLEQVGVENGEGGAQQPEAQSHGRRDRRSEQRRSPEGPYRVADVLEE